MEIDIPKDQEETPREEKVFAFEEEGKEGRPMDLGDGPDRPGGDSDSDPEKQPFHILGSRIFWVVGSISVLVAIFIGLVMLVRPWEEWEQIVEMQRKPHREMASLDHKDREQGEAKLFAAERMTTTSPEVESEKAALDQDGDSPAGEYREGTTSITVKVPPKESTVAQEEEGTEPLALSVNAEKGDAQEVEAISPIVSEPEADAVTATGKQEIPEEAAMVVKNPEAAEPSAKLAVAEPSAKPEVAEPSAKLAVAEPSAKPEVAEPSAKPEVAESSAKAEVAEPPAQKTRPAPPEPVPAAEKAPPVSGPKFSVNLASYKKKALADLYVVDLQKRGVDAFVWEISLPEKGTWYRVSSGRFGDLKEARSSAGKIQEKWKLDTCVVKIPSGK